MLARDIAPLLHSRLQDYPGAVVVGPRQCGKTTLGEAHPHVREEINLSRGMVDDPAPGRIVEFRKRLRLSRQKFADRYGLDARTRKEREHGSRRPDWAAGVLLTVIERDPEDVARAFGEPVGHGESGHFAVS